MAHTTDLDKATRTAWAAKAHLYVLDALMGVSTWNCKDIAFHGGTSLHLSWNSPRRSEDLDFLIARDVGDIVSVMKAVVVRVQERFMIDDPRIIIEAKDRTRDADRMPKFEVLVSSTERRGKAAVKVEFWRVDREYLEVYPIEFKTPLSAGDIVSSVFHPLPVARLRTAFADKLTAFATRPYLKWRDIFDLWWIGTQTREPLDVVEVSKQFLHNVSAYSTRNGLSPADALRLFLDLSNDEVLAAAEKDLKPWVSEQLWERLNPGTINEMVDYCRNSLSIVADYISFGILPEDEDVLKRGRR